MASSWFVAINASINHITCYQKDSHESLVWQGENYPDFVVEGCIFEVDPTREWMFGSTQFISGPIMHHYIDIPALGLVPLRVRECLPKSKEYKMEQIIPGWEPNVFGSDPILMAVELRNQGDALEACDALRKILKQDMRCIDAHVHLGNFTFDDAIDLSSVRIALKHYTVAVSMGTWFLGENFKGTLPWGWINNRPFLRALHGQCLCYWALDQWREALKVAKYILKLNPLDNQGVEQLIIDLKAKKPYFQE